MADETTQLAEELKAVITEARQLNEKAAKREADGNSAVLLKESVDKALAEGTRIATEVEKLEAKFLASSTRQVITDPTEARLSAVRGESVMVGQYFKTGKLSDDYSNVIKLAMATDNSSGHQVIMPPTMGTGILQRLRDASTMEQVCDVELIDGVTWERLKQIVGTGAGRTSERGARAATTMPTFGKDRIDTGSYYTEPAMSQELIYMVKDFDLGAYVMDDGNMAMQDLAEADYMTGTGVGGYPLGVLANTTLQAASVHSGSASGLGTSFDPILNMTAGVHETMLQNSRWMLRRATEVSISLLKGGDGKYLWQPSIAAGVPNTIFGYPVNYNGFMPLISDYATNPYPVIFGNFKEGYKIIISRFMLLIRDEVTSKGNVIMYKEIKKGGDVRRTEAFSLLKIATP